MKARSNGRRRSRSAFVSLLAVLLLESALGSTLLLAQPARSGGEGPIIGVQIADGRATHRIVAGPGGLQIEWPGQSKRLPAGIYSIDLASTGATFSGRAWGHEVPFGREVPFRLRGVESALRLGERFYEGWLEVHVPTEESKWKVVNRLPIEKYLLGVLPGEMPVSKAPMASLAAQAVASRSYALFQILVRPEERRIHVKNDTRSQVYLGGGVPDPRVLEAVESTRGEVVLLEGRVFESFFHSTCGGATRSVEDCFGGDAISSLVGVRCQGCTTSKYYRWNSRISLASLSKALLPTCRKHEIDLGTIEKVEPVEPGPGGHCSYVRITHAKGSFELDADKFRRICRDLGAQFRSTSFIAERKGTDVVIYGRGWGHGVGLCQVGAMGLAEKGNSYSTILQHYYSGVEVQPLW